MVGFEYNGKSTATIIDTPLILVSTDSVGSAIGIQRSKIEGERTISRPITNEYGTISDPLSFTYGLMKKDFETFTVEEQIAVERWLTSPKFSSEIKITNCEEESYSYFGLFTNTEWLLGNGDFMICNFTFQVNGMYAFKKYEKTKSGENFDDEEDPDKVTSVDDSFMFYINNDTDELEEYIYPVIEVTSCVPYESEDYYTANSSFKLINYTDNNQEIKVETNKKTTLVMDCQHCLIGEYAEGINNNISINTFRYKDIGWTDMGKIYWPRLLPGENVWEIQGKVKMKVAFYYPYKKVGGWLI